MLKRERQSHIIQQLNVHNKVLSGHLSEQLQVSEDTVRRDLQELSDQGLLIKVHGGALSNSFHFTLQNAQIYSPTEKRTIAEKAAPANKLPIPYTEKKAAHRAIISAVIPITCENLDFGNNKSFIDE